MEEAEEEVLPGIVDIDCLGFGRYWRSERSRHGAHDEGSLYSWRYFHSASGPFAEEVHTEAGYTDVPASAQ